MKKSGRSVKKIRKSSRPTLCNDAKYFEKSCECILCVIGKARRNAGLEGDGWLDSRAGHGRVRMGADNLL